MTREKDAFLEDACFYPLNLRIFQTESPIPPRTDSAEIRDTTNGWACLKQIAPATSLGSRLIDKFTALCFSEEFFLCEQYVIPWPDAVTRVGLQGFFQVIQEIAIMSDTEVVIGPMKVDITIELVFL